MTMALHFNRDLQTVKTIVVEYKLCVIGPVTQTRMWANAQPDGRPAEHRWRPLFNAPKFA